MKYKATITGLGECALDFLDECCNFIIIFNEDAPPELADISVLHTKSEVKEDPKKGDTVRICGVEYTIADVGWEALNTLKELGHCTLSFKGLDTVKRPGIIELIGEPIKAEQLLVGGTIEMNKAEEQELRNQFLRIEVRK